jgi:TolB-like protein
MPISKVAILEQLDKIVSSKLFNESYKLQRFLKYVVVETVEERNDHLKQYNIAINAFDRPEDFDANSDPIVRIQAGRLRSSLASYYLTVGINDEILIEIPKGSYKPQIKPKRNNDPLVALHSFNDDVIGVELFKNLSKDHKQDYIVSGFKEELLLELARYDHLTIIRLASNEGDTRVQRNARFLLKGSIRFDDARIKLVVMVEDAKVQDVIWSQKFDLLTDPKELINSQEAIAKSVANKVGDVIGGVVFKRLLIETRKRAIKDMTAYDALLKFYYYQQSPSVDRYEEAMVANKKVLEKDPENGVSWALLSSLIIDSIALGFSPAQQNDFDKPLEYALKAVALEPNMQLTRTYLAYAYLMSNQFENTIEQAEIGLSFNPNAAFYVGSLGWVMALAGNWGKGLELIEEGIYLNPSYPAWYHQATCFYYLGKGNFEQALVEANKLNIESVFWDPLLKAVSNVYLGNIEKAQLCLKQLVEIAPNFNQDGEALIKMYVKEALHFERIKDGLQQAGFSLEEKKELI